MPSPSKIAPPSRRRPFSVPSVLSVLFVPFLLSFTACGDRAPTASTPPPAALAPATSWPMTRGGPALTGAVATTAPRAPVTAWTFTSSGPISGEAAIADGRVFIGTNKGTLHALDAATGKELWSFTTKDSITAAPAVVAGKVFVSSNDGRLYALDAATGTEAWQFSSDEKITAGAIPIKAPADSATPGADWLLLNGYDGTLRVLAPADGKLLWSYKTEDYINGSPAVVEGRYVVFGGCDAHLHVVRLADGKLVHKIPTSAQIPASIATFGPMAYCGNYANETVAFDAVSGKVAWTYEDRQLPFMSAPAVNEKLVLIGSRDKHLHAINRTTGQAAWTFKTGGRVEGSPIVFTDAVVFGSADGRLYAANLADGTELWQLDLGEALVSSPAFGARQIIIGGDKGTVFALKSSSP